MQAATIITEEINREREGLPGQRPPEFRYAHAPKDWDWIPAKQPIPKGAVPGQWIPLVVPLVMVIGVNGMGRGKRGRTRWKGLHEENGFRYIGLDAPVLTTAADGSLSEGVGYLARHNSTQRSDSGAPKFCYTPVWCHPLVIEGNPARVDYASLFDYAGFFATMQLWLRRGLTHPLTALNLQNRMAILERRENRRILDQRHANSPEVVAYMQRDLEQVRAMLVAGRKLESSTRIQRASDGFVVLDDSLLAEDEPPVEVSGDA